MTVETGTNNFTIRQGATFTRVYTWKDDAGATINLTGYTARMQIRQRIGGEIFADLTTENGGITLGGALGTITILISATATAAIVENGVFDLELVSGSGIVTRLIQGNMTLSKQVTV